MSPALVNLSLHCGGLAAEVRFNDVPIFAGAPRQSVNHAEKLNQWVLAGPNLLTVSLALPPGPAGAGQEFELEVVLAQTGKPGGRKLADYRWTPGAPPLSPTPVPVFREELTLDAPAPWRWAAAPRLPALSPNDRAAITATLTALHDALAERNLDAIARLQALQLEEQSIAVGEDIATGRADYLQLLRDLMADNWRVSPLQPGRLDYRLCGNGRLVQAAGPAGQDALLAHSGMGDVALSPYLSKIGGQWTIVR